MASVDALLGATRETDCRPPLETLFTWKSSGPGVVDVVDVKNKAPVPKENVTTALMVAPETLHFDV